MSIVPADKPKRYIFQAVVPRKYIDVKCSCITGEDLSEFWGTCQPLHYEEWTVDHLEICDFNILRLIDFDENHAVELYLHDRKSLLVYLEVDFCASMPEDDVGDWIAELLPGDWSIDEVAPMPIALIKISKEI